MAAIKELFKQQEERDAAKAKVAADAGEAAPAADAGEAAPAADAVEATEEGDDDDDDDEEVVDVNAAGAGGRRPIHRAAGANHVDVIRFLLEKGAVVDQVDKSNRTALHWAAISGHVQAGEILVEAGADIQATTDSQTTPLHAACESGRAEFVAFLLTRDESKVEAMCNAKDGDGKLPFDLAASGKHKAVAEALKGGGDPHAASATCIVS